MIVSELDLSLTKGNRTGNVSQRYDEEKRFLEIAEKFHGMLSVPGGLFIVCERCKDTGCMRVYIRFPDRQMTDSQGLRQSQGILHGVVRQKLAMGE